MSGHLVHGMGTELEAPTWPIVTADEADGVLDAFPQTGRLVGLTWHSPRPFSAAVLVQAERGEFLLKRHHPALRSPAALAEEHAFMAYLQSAGLQVPEVMQANDGASAIRHGAWTYELHRKAEGLDLYRERPSWTPFLSLDHAFAAGQSLARCHAAARGFDAPERPPHPLVASLTILRSPDPLAATGAYIAARPALARFMVDKPWQAELSRLFAELGHGLAERVGALPRLWTHNDWHPSNLLWSAEGEVSTVFDFGLAAPTCALHDVAIAIERTAIPWLELSAGRSDASADPTAAARLLAGYRQVSPLSEDEIDTFIRLLPLVHVEFALSEVDYFIGVLADREQAELAWQDYAIGHAEWFRSSSGRAFLQLLRREAIA